MTIAHEMIRIVYFVLERAEPYRGENIEKITIKLEGIKYKVSIGWQT